LYKDVNIAREIFGDDVYEDIALFAVEHIKMLGQPRIADRPGIDASADLAAGHRRRVPLVVRLRGNIGRKNADNGDDYNNL